VRFEELYTALREQAYFDYSTVALLFHESSPASLRTALYRFVRDGKLVSLRRELYAFNAPYARAELHGALVANVLYAPSYLSGLWVLGWLGVIPEKVLTYTSVSPRPARSFANAWGGFEYRSLKQELFKGYEKRMILGAEALMARPEKALLDHWYLEPGEWTAERMQSMRFNPSGISGNTIAELAQAYKTRRIDAALTGWASYSREHHEGVAI